MAKDSQGELAGRVAWVTGGASGMGLAAAVRLAAMGAKADACLPCGARVATLDKPLPAAL